MSHHRRHHGHKHGRRGPGPLGGPPGRPPIGAALGALAAGGALRHAAREHQEHHGHHGHHGHHHSHVAEKVAAGVVIGAALGAGAAMAARRSGGSRRGGSSKHKDDGGYYGAQEDTGYYGSQPESGYYGAQQQQPVVAEVPIAVVAEPVPAVQPEPVVQYEPQPEPVVESAPGYYGSQPAAVEPVVEAPLQQQVSQPIAPVVVEPVQSVQPVQPLAPMQPVVVQPVQQAQPAYNPMATGQSGSQFEPSPPQVEGQSATVAASAAVTAGAMAATSAPVQPMTAPVVQPAVAPVSTQPVGPYYQPSQPFQPAGYQGPSSSDFGGAPMYPTLPAKPAVEEKKRDEQKPKGTIVPQRPYNQSHASEDARRLRAAFKGFGCDKKVVVEITGSRSHIQRIMIKKAYRTVDPGKERNLMKDLQGELGGELRKLVLLLYAEKGSPEAKWMKEAFSGAGYNTNLLNEVLFTKTNAELKEMKTAWRHISPKEDLMKRLSSETSKRFSAGHYRDLCCGVLLAERPEGEPVDPTKVRQDAELLNRMLNQAKSSEAKTKFVQVFTTRSWAHLAAVANAFQEISKKYTLCAAVKEAFGDSDTSKAIRTITSYALNPYDYWARHLQDAMKGLGTDDCKLRRVVVSRCEKDLAEVIKVFGQRYGKGKTLKSWIDSDTRGEYRDLLLKLCGY